MICFPNAKINLGLRIVRRRSDGFHDISTCFAPIALKDALELLPARDGICQITQTGQPLDIAPEQNICMRAWQLVRELKPETSPVKIHLHKAIPSGAGLGGGSADGTFTLLTLQRMFHLELTSDQLAALALRLGSDCPFFLRNQPCIGEGRGDILTGLTHPLPSFKIRLINPGIPVSTAWAFSKITPRAPAEKLEDILQLSPDQWKDRLINDFEPAVFNEFPSIAAIKAWLYAQGAVYASLSGTGSTVYGLFDGELPDATGIFPPDYLIYDSVL